MEVPQKYRSEQASGASEQCVAKSLIRDGYGKLRSITLLRRLFELSLKDAEQVYEKASLRTIQSPEVKREFV